MVIRITMITITTISSTKVKPRKRRQAICLPFSIGLTIRIHISGFRKDVKDVLSAPGSGLGVVLIAVHTPVILAGEGVARDSAQELHLLAVGALAQLHALYKDVQSLGI